MARNKIYYLENSMIIYGIYNAETVEKIVNTSQKIHNKTTWNERLFSAKHDSWYIVIYHKKVLLTM